MDTNMAIVNNTWNSNMGYVQYLSPILHSYIQHLQIPKQINTSEAPHQEDYTSDIHFAAVDSSTAVPVDTLAEVHTDTSPKELDIPPAAHHSYTPSHINVLVVSTPH
jgi:hypothetical protein